MIFLVISHSQKLQGVKLGDSGQSVCCKEKD
jgi:hypothetical protein